MIGRRVCGLILLAACSGEPEKQEAPTPPPVEAPPAPPAKLNLGDLQAQASMDAMVPSPAETQLALTQAGLSSSLAKLAEQRDIKVDVADADEVAVRTGVVLAHVVLCAKTAPKEKLVLQLGQLKLGLQKLGGSEKVLKTVDDLSARVANDASGRDDLVREMDELANVMVPEVESNLQGQSLPLLRAGAWLEGAWLVTGALQAEGKYDAATSLLRQPHVVRYFKDYLYGEGKQVGPAAIHAELQATLNTLETVVNKEALTQEDVATIHTATDGLLAKLKD